MPQSVLVCTCRSGDISVHLISQSPCLYNEEKRFHCSHSLPSCMYKYVVAVYSHVMSMNQLLFKLRLQSLVFLLQFITLTFCHSQLLFNQIVRQTSDGAGAVHHGLSRWGRYACKSLDPQSKLLVLLFE